MSAITHTHTHTHTRHHGLNSIFVVLHRPHCLLSHHDAQYSRGYSNHVLLLPAGCCLEHGQWSTEPYCPAALQIISGAIHDPWKCVHEHVNVYEITKFCVMCALLLFTFCILNKLFVGIPICYTLKCDNALAVSVSYEFLAALHQIKIYALIPNSWFRRFCRSRYQTR